MFHFGVARLLGLLRCALCLCLRRWYVSVRVVSVSVCVSDSYSVSASVSVSDFVSVSVSCRVFFCVALSFVFCPVLYSNIGFASGLGCGSCDCSVCVSAFVCLSLYGVRVCSSYCSVVWLRLYVHVIYSCVWRLARQLFDLYLGDSECGVFSLLHIGLMCCLHLVYVLC